MAATGKLLDGLRPSALAVGRGALGAAQGVATMAYIRKMAVPSP